MIAWTDSEDQLLRDAAPEVDGSAVRVAANVGSLADAEQAQSAGADTIGLVRTEFLFLDRAEAPDVEEQEAAHRARELSVAPAAVPLVKQAVRRVDTAVASRLAR